MARFKQSARGRLPMALRLVTTVAALSLAAACGGGSPTSAADDQTESDAATSAATPVAPAVLEPGQAIPLPSEPILVLQGSISGTNHGDVLQLGVETLDQFGLQEVHVYEPWVKKDLGFQGVWLADLLEVAGVDATARDVHIVALDDYAVDLTMAEVAKGGILLATRSADGAPLPIDQGGPTRIVFVDGVDAGANADQWIWSLKDIRVR